MNRKSRRVAFNITTLAILVLLSLHPVQSAEYKLLQYAMYAGPQMKRENCSLVERYTKSGGETNKIQGYLDDYGCNVSVKKEQYENLFLYCYQSGINVHRISGDNSFECFIQEREDDYLFLTHFSKNAGRESQVMCYFSCISR